MTLTPTSTPTPAVFPEGHASHDVHPAPRLTSEGEVAALRTFLEDNKAEEITVLAIADKTVMADYLVIATGMSRAHIHALAGKILETFSTPNHLIRRDGFGATDWVVLDTGTVMVHLFRPEARTLYNLEGMWS